MSERQGQSGFTAGGRAPVEYWLSWPPAEGDQRGGAAAGGEAASRFEAAAVARDLADLHAREGLPWRAFGLLLRCAGDLDLYLEALRARGIPFAVGRDKQYYRRREVIEAAALVRAVLDPGDHVALLTLLRSPMVGVPDAALIPLWRRQLPRRLTELGSDAEGDAAALAELAGEVAAAAGELPADVPGLAALAGWDASLLAAAEHLAAARRAFRELTADRFVATLRALFLPEAGRGRPLSRRLPAGQPRALLPRGWSASSTTGAATPPASCAASAAASPRRPRRRTRAPSRGATTPCR